MAAESFRRFGEQVDDAVQRQALYGEVDALIDATEGMTDISKIYMKKFLAMRLNQMLLPAWKKAQEHQAREDGESRGFSR